MSDQNQDRQYADLAAEVVRPRKSWAPITPRP